MTSDPSAHTSPGDPVTLLSSSPFENVGKARQFEAVAPAECEDLIVLISFDASQYPLEDHCRHAVHRDPDSPYTFPNFKFRSQPPGIRVGPWPGWRGIPLMPSVTIKTGEAEQELSFQFWGDELDRRRLRAAASFKSFPDKRIVVNAGTSGLVPLEAEFYAVRTLNPIPFEFDISPDKLRSHPRLLIDESDLTDLRSNPSPARGESLDRIREFIPRWNQSLTVTPESKLPPGPELPAPEDRLLISAFLTLIDPSPETIERARKSLLDYCALTERPDFAPLTIDTQSGETLFLLCVGYDWLFTYLKSDEEQRIRKRLWEVAEICWNHLGYERKDFAQAHYLGCGLGLLAFSLLFWDKHPKAHEWSRHLAGVLKLVLSVLPEDGFFPHGTNLWIYEFGFLLRWLELLRSSGIDLWPKTPVLRNASAFRAATTSPDGLCGVTFGDPQFRVGGDSWCHDLIALRTGSGGARGLGDFLRDLPVEGVDFRHAPARRRVYEYLWSPEQVKPEATPDGITVVHDGTQVFARTSEALFTFRSGPPLGFHRYEQGITGGYGHSDPGSGSFLLYERGSMVIAGPGPVYRRDSSLQNIVTINGRGQIGDSAVWMPDFIPPSFQAPGADTREMERTVAATVDLARSYFPHLGVKVLRRSIIAEAGRYVIGADTVTLASEANIEWNLHSANEFVPVKEPGGLRFTIGSANSRWTVLVTCSPGKTSAQTGLSDFVPAYPNNGARDYFLRVTSRGDHAMIHWCICLAEDIPGLRIRKNGHAGWMFSDGTAVDFDGTWMSLKETP